MSLSFPLEATVSLSNLCPLNEQRRTFLGPDFHKIAGSDLDGDEYFVSETKSLRFILSFLSFKDLLGRRTTIEMSSRTARLYAREETNSIYTDYADRCDRLLSVHFGRH